MRAIVLVIDGFGVGAQPDARLYGDEGANTALHICDAIPQPKWTCLKKLGLGNCAGILGYHLTGCEPIPAPLAGFGVMAQASPGKDTTTGHWEIAGVVLHEPFHTFPPDFPSFPASLVEDFENRTGFKLLGNKSASGTAVIEELGPAHIRGEGLIVYTSADSVFQIAAHEDILPVNRLYEICQIARELCDPYRVGRVIARPFTGPPGKFIRTAARKDFSISPPGATILDHLSQKGIETIGIGKIGDIFAEKGLAVSHHDTGNPACLERTMSCLKQKSKNDKFLFINLVDTDMLFGHRRDINGYHDTIQAIDDALVRVIDLLSGEDLLVITSDHGCDPGYKGTDHTREYVPLLVYQKHRQPKNLGTRTSFSDVAQSLTTFFNVSALEHGVSFIHDVNKAFPLKN